MMYEYETGSWVMTAEEKKQVIAELVIDGRAFTMDEVIFVEREVGIWAMWFRTLR